MPVRFKGNDKVHELLRPWLREQKAIKQGLYLKGGFWWPELDGLTPEAERRVRDAVRDTLVWQASLPRYTVDGVRYA